MIFGGGADCSLRLGFFSPSDEDDKERKSVMAKYAEMAQDVSSCLALLTSGLSMQICGRLHARLPCSIHLWQSCKSPVVLC